MKNPTYDLVLRNVEGARGAEDPGRIWCAELEEEKVGTDGGPEDATPGGDEPHA